MLGKINAWYQANKIVIWVALAMVVLVTILSLGLLWQHAEAKADKAKTEAAAAQNTLKQTQESNHLTNTAEQNWRAQQKEAASDVEQTNHAVNDLHSSTDRVRSAAENARSRLCQSTAAHRCHAQ